MAADRQLVDPFFRRPWLAVLLAVVVRTASVAYLRSAYGSNSPRQLVGRFAIWVGDSDSYLGPIDNYLRTGEYFWWNGLERIKAGRMPFYGVPYYLARALLDAGPAYDAVVALQVLADAIATVCLAALAFALTGSRGVAVAVFLLASANLLAATYALWLVPESLSLSAVAILLLAYHRFLQSAHPVPLLVSAAAFAALVCLKPYMSPLGVALAAGTYWIVWRRRGDAWRAMRAVMVLTVIVMLPLIPWTVRNWLVLERFIPFQGSYYAGYPYQPGELAARRFLETLGQSHMWWDKRSGGCYLFRRQGYDCVVKPDEGWVAPGYGLDDIARARDELRQLQPDDFAGQVRVAATFDWMASLHRAAYPVHYAVIAPLNLMRAMLLHSGSYFLPRGRDTRRFDELAVKWWQTLVYYFIVVAGPMGILVLMSVDRTAIVLTVIPSYLVILFPIVLRAVEFRVFDHALPGLLVSACGGLHAAWRGRLVKRATRLRPEA